MQTTSRSTKQHGVTKPTQTPSERARNGDSHGREGMGGGGMRWWIPGRATRSREAAPGELAPGPGCGARRRRPRPPLHRRSPNRSPRTGKREPGRDSRRRRRPRWLRRAAARAPPPPPPPPAGPPPWASPLCVGSRKSEGLGLDANGPLFAFTLFQTFCIRGLLC